MSSNIRYPVLFECETKEQHGISELAPFVVGRSQNASLPVFDSLCSRRHFQITFRDVTYFVESLSESGPTYCNNVSITRSRPLSHGDIVQAGSSLFIFMNYDDPGLLKSEPVPLAQRKQTTPPDFQPYPTEQATVLSPGSKVGDVEKLGRSFAIAPQMLIGRDKERVTIHLPHSQVSRLHAQITVRGREIFLDDLKSANGTFVNGRRINEPVVIKVGDQIDIGPYALAFNGKSLLERSRVNNVELACTGLKRVVKDRETGGMLTLLDEINLLIRPGEFVCLLGPSGSGKSTLLSALSARAPAESGRVTVSGKDLYANFEALKRDIAVVHQKDLMHDFLDVETVLRYTAKLRLPPDTSSREIEALVSEILTTVGLTERARTQIRNLSGGELKRASLANEIISKPSLLFLDEVTSGLDEQTDADLMKLFRKIAEGGKTVVCITHSTANVEEYCHRIVVLAKGGKLAFVGTPREVLSYFKVQRLGDVYNKLKELKPDDWKERFHQINRISSTPPIVAPTDQTLGPDAEGRQTISVAGRARMTLRQTVLLTQRYLNIQLTDKKSLLMTLGQCVLVGLFVVLLFGDIKATNSDEVVNPNLPPKEWKLSAEIMFLMGISAFWFGCNNAAKELVKERVIYTRERDINLLVTSYLASKILLLGAISFIQSVLLYVIVTYGTSVDHSFSQFIMVLTLSIAGVGMGLLISALSQTTDMAVTIVPLVLIPQIVFSGMIGNIEGFAQFVATYFIIVYWGYGGLITTLPDEISEGLQYDEWSTFQSWLVVALHATLYFGGALLVMSLAAAREAAYGKAIQKLLSATRLRMTR